MARRRLAEAVAEEPSNRFEASCHPVEDATLLLQIRFSSKDLERAHEALQKASKARGAFVMLEPAHDVTDAGLEVMKAAARAAGAALVLARPRPRGAVVPRAHEPFTSPRATVREHLRAILEETNSKDIGALTALLDASLARRGL